MLQTDALREFRYEPSLNRYRVVSGSGRGQFISKEAFLRSTERYIVEQSNKLVELGSKLASQAIGLNAFQREAAQYLKEIHISQVILANRGVENLTSSDWGIVGNTLKKQYYSGKDPETGSKYGLKWLVEDVKAGNVSEAQLRARLALYAKSGKISYWDQIERLNRSKPFAKRILGVAEHCPDCLSYAAMGVRPKSEVPKPAERCSCKVNCKCSLLYLSLEEAIKEGYRE